MDYAVAAVRRQTKVDSDSLSLARILSELSNHPETVPRAEVEKVPAHLEEPVRTDSLEAARAFFNTFASPGASHVDPERVKADSKRLDKSLTAVEHVADRLVAHLDKRPPPERLRDDELFVAIDVLVEMFQRYRTLICGGPWDFNLPESAGTGKSCLCSPGLMTRNDHVVAGFLLLFRDASGGSKHHRSCLDDPRAADGRMKPSARGISNHDESVYRH